APSSAPEERGNFQGTALNGLKSGYVLNGPLQADGVPKFTIQLLGYGGTRRVDTTELWFGTNQGTSSSASTDTSTNLPSIWVKYKDRDGLTNYLSPADPFKVNFTWNLENYTNATVTDGDSNFGNVVRLTLGGAVYTVANDKVVFLDAITPVGNNNYTADFYIGGNPNLNPEAFRVTIGPMGLQTNTSLTVGGISGFVCNVELNSSTTVELRHNVTAQNCDLVPNYVRFGPATVVDARAQAMSLFHMGNGIDEIYTNGNWSRGGRLVTTGGSPFFMPYVRVTENSSISQTGVLGPRNYTVIYDSRPDINWYGASETTPRYGLVVTDARTQYMNLSVPTAPIEVDPFVVLGSNATYAMINETTLNLSSNSSSSPLVGQDVDPVAYLESLKYHVTAFGTEFDGSTLGELKVIHPEDQRDAVVRVSGPTIAVGNASAVLKEGDELSGVKVLAVNGAVGGTENLRVSGAAGTTVYTKGGKLDGARLKNLIVLDTGATATYKVVVGGPWVNRLAEGMQYPAGLTQAAGNSYVHAEGNNVLVAGYSGTDSASAADALVDLLMG
ncbi:hypothetical protein HY546_00570, partial [archaeon]|nr:hypothetical protein [archaeon]